MFDTDESVFGSLRAKVDLPLIYRSMNLYEIPSMIFNYTCETWFHRFQ